jgi:hypothetical protein
MYDALLITFDLDIYRVKFKNYSKVSCLFIALTTIRTHSLTQSDIIGNSQNPCCSRCLLNLPPILGGVPSLSNSSAPPSHTPVSATVLGSTLFGSTFIGSNSQGPPSTCSPLHRIGGATSSQGGSTNPPSPLQGSGTQNTHTMARTNPMQPPHIPYLAFLNIMYLTKLTNDPILHNPTWPAMPTKLPSYIPKFEGKAGDDPTNHIMTFHLWFSSNNIMDDSI